MPVTNRSCTKLVVVIAKEDHGIVGSDREGQDRFGLMVGVTSDTAESTMRLVCDYVRKCFGAGVISVFESWVPDWTGRDADLWEEIVGDPAQEGIWYASSRAWFAEGDEEILRDLI